MMVLVDTSAWIEYLADLRALLLRGPILAVEGLQDWEVAAQLYRWAGSRWTSAAEGNTAPAAPPRLSHCGAGALRRETPPGMQVLLRRVVLATLPTKVRS